MLRDWLQSIGLGDHADAFEREGITLEIAGTLSDADLAALGLLRMGERRTFQLAVRGQAPGALDVLQPGFAEAQAPLRPAGRAGGIMERRPLTLMFADVVGSTALLERWGDEAFQAMLLHYRQIGSDACQRFGGQVYRYLGDAILAYFCYPRANENDPERAVRAALELGDRMAEVRGPNGESVACRIGIATGRVIIGDMFSPGAVDWSSVIGNAANLAAKLQTLAPLNGVIVSDETRAKIVGRFELRDLGSRPIAGFSGETPIWQVLGLRSLADRQGGGQSSPLQGREGELERLTSLWHQVEAGRGAAALLQGEPGIGKSRLLRQVVDRLAADGVRILRLSGSSLDIDTPLEPFLAWLRSAAGLQSGLPAETARERLASVLRGTVQAREQALPLLCELLGLEPPSSSVGLPAGAWRPGLPPARLRALSIAALVGQIQEAATDRPLLLAVEDLHWFDPTSREALSAILEDRAARRMLVLITGRDGQEAEQVAGHCDAVLPLAPLDRTETAALVRGLAGGATLRPRIIEAILDKAEGVPLFVEEFTRALLMRGAAHADALEAGGSEPPVPGSIDELLVERLDRAGPAKGIAQAASVFGTSVRLPLLAAATGLGHDELLARLGELQRVGVLRPAGDHWQFTHALLRDAAYGGLVAERRRDLHARAAQAIEAIEPELRERQPAVFAHHLMEAGRTEEAAGAWVEAGRRALSRSALEEASRVLRRGLDALERLPADTSILEARVEIMALLGPALMALHGSASAEAKTLYAFAYDLCQMLPEARTHFPIYWAWWRQSSDFVVKAKRAGRLLERARRRADPELLLQAHHCGWASEFSQGRLCECLDHIGEGLRVYEAHDFRDHAQLYGNHDPKVCAHGNTAQVLWMQGRPVTAMGEERKARHWAAELDHLGSRVHVADMELLHAVYRRDMPRVASLADALTRIAEEHGLKDCLSKAMIFAGWARALSGDTAEGLAAIEQGFARQRDVGTQEDFPIYFALLAEALALAGQPDRALAELKRARNELDGTGIRFWMPELWRMLGDMALEVDPRDAASAAASYARAQMLAEEQGAHMLALRAAIGASRLDLRMGRFDEAGARLASAQGLIAEDDGGPDLTEARALARRISGRRGPKAVEPAA